MTEDKNLNTNEPDGSNANPNPDGGGEPKPKLYDEKFVKELQTETIQRRKKIDELEAKLKAIEDTKLTDLEKKDKRVKELEDEIENMKNADKAAKVDTLIVEAISDKNIIDKSTMKLLIKNELTSEEEITDKVVEKVVDKLLKEKPYLVNSSNVNPSNGNFAKQGNEPNSTLNEWTKILKG